MNISKLKRFAAVAATVLSMATIATPAVVSATPALAASTSQPGQSGYHPTGWHLSDPSEFTSLDQVYLNGSGGGCANYTHIIGWDQGGFANEKFNLWTDSSHQYYSLQAAWCANNGTAFSGQCVWDNSTSNHGLVLYPCNETSGIDGFYFQLNNSQGVYQLINAAYLTYANCQYQGQWCWDGGYTRYRADWYIYPV